MALPQPKGKQLEVLDLKPEGHNVVLGTAGSGKTTLAIYRAIYLATLDDKEKVMLVTFNTTLVKYLEAIVGSEIPRNIEVRNYHKFARGYLAHRNKMPRWNGIVSGIEDGDNKKQLFVRRALENVKAANGTNSTLKRAEEVFLEEINWIEKMGIKTLDEYEKVERVGRFDTRIIRENRKYFFQVYKAYLEVRKEEGYLYDWLKYERGGGGATKRAAQKWADNISPWDEKSNSPLEIKDYFMAGGNGVAMRIIPHIFKNEENIEKIMAQVVLNGMYTHGHPRALIGAMLYAMAVRTLIQQDAVLSYGELIDVLIEEEKQWSELPEVSNIAIWKCEAERYAQYDYDQIWNECVLETIDYLKIAKEALNQGILDLGHDTLQKLGCYNSRINGAGNVSAVISIYLFSKYADDPVMAVYETANLNNADTDTLASMVGGLVGALNGKDWIPIELRGVQDYSLFEYLIEQMMDEKCDFLNSDKQYQLFNNEKMATLEIGDSIECLPFGEITLKEIREDKPKRAGMYVKVYVWKTAYGQTIFSKKIGKKTLNMEQTIPHTVEKKHSPEIQFTVQKLKDIKKLLIKVSDAADFVEILSEIVQMKIDDDISKEKIDEMKVKWKPYKITKKQIVSIYELL